MKAPGLHWSIYGPDQVRPALRGNLVYLLEVAATGRAPILRDIFDPSGREFPNNAPARIRALIQSGYHGVVYQGVSKAAVFDVMEHDPRILADDTTFERYNRELLENARRFFLQNPHGPVPETEEVLLGGGRRTEREPALRVHNRLEEPSF